MEVTDNVDCPSFVTLPNNTELTFGLHALVMNATDSFGNIGHCTSYILITDPYPPSITCPSHTINLSTNSGRSYATLNCSLFPYSQNHTLCPRVSDFVGISALTQTPPGEIAFGTNTITFAASDVAGNTAECHSSVAVLDEEPPIVYCPSNISLPEGSDSLYVTVSILIGASDNVGLSRARLAQTGNGATIAESLWSFPSLVSSTMSTLLQPTESEESGSGTESEAAESSTHSSILTTTLPSISMMPSSAPFYNRSSIEFNVSRVSEKSIDGFVRYFSDEVNLDLLPGTALGLQLFAVDWSANVNTCTFFVTITQSVLTKSLFSLVSSPLTIADVGIFANITQSSATMTGLQASVSANLADSLVVFTNVSSMSIFQTLNNLAELTPHAIAVAQLLNEGATKIRSAVLTFAEIVDTMSSHVEVQPGLNSSSYEGKSLSVDVFSVDSLLVSIVTFNKTLPTAAISQSSASNLSSTYFQSNSTHDSHGQIIFNIPTSSLIVNANVFSAFYTIFRDDSLFPQNITENQTRATVASAVIDVTLSGAKLSGNPVDFLIEPYDFDANQNYVCVFWVETEG